MAQKYNSRHKGQELSKTDESDQYTNPRISPNANQNKYKRVDLKSNQKGIKKHIIYWRTVIKIVTDF